MTDEIKLAKASWSMFPTVTSSSNPWSPQDIDKMESKDILKEYRKVVKMCKFFYRRDPIASSIINKLVDIGINGLTYEKSNLSSNEEKIVNYLIRPLKEFAESMALEFLISGLVIPEVKYAEVTKRDLNKIGVKRYSSLSLPTSMFLRDPQTIKINTSFGLDEPSYYLEVPDKLIIFITNRGTYPDGTKDEEAYRRLVTLYPDFVRQIQEGKREILLENPLILRRRNLSDSPYPVPYLYAALEPLKHKRNLRRMDYSVASRVISAILLIKMGSDDFPVTEEDSDQFKFLEDQLKWRTTGDRDIERIFQLFANHTVTMEWIMPDIAALVDDSKYKDVNRDIFYALGFPGILVTGESERTGASEAEYAMMSPVKTMNSFREKIIHIVNEILYTVFENNNFRGSTTLRFDPINLHSFRYFAEALSKLYETGNLSRTSYTGAYGYNFEDEVVTMSGESDLLKKHDVPEFPKQPFTPQDTQNNNNNSTNNQQK